MRVAFSGYDKLVNLKDLKSSRYQRNTHPKNQIERLARIMKEHGIRQPISISKQTGEVVFGHGRWEAAKLNGWTKYPVVYQSFKNNKEEFACVQSDNAIASWAELDLEKIELDLNTFDLDRDLLGLKEFKSKTEFIPSEITQEFNLLIECSTEVDQQNIFTKLEKEGLRVRIL